MSTTLAQARTLLADYVGARYNFTTRLNLACERLIKSGNWRATKNTLRLNVFPDAAGQAFVTLPYYFNTILGGVFLRNCGNGQEWGWPVSIRNGWYNFSTGGPGLITDPRYGWIQGIIPETDRFTTFRDWSIPIKIRLKFATTETNPSTFIVRGNLNGQPVYTGTGTGRIEGEALVYTGSSPITSTSDFDEPPYEFVKPVTNGAVSMYTWDGVTETLVAIYAPGETSPSWRRYRVPGCTNWTEADPGQFLTVCKREWQPLVNDNDAVIPSNIGALRFALDALNAEDSQDPVRATQHWNDAKMLLANESDDDTGYAAEGSVHVNDDFSMQCMGAGYYYNY